MRSKERFTSQSALAMLSKKQKSGEGSSYASTAGQNNWNSL